VRAEVAKELATVLDDAELPTIAILKLYHDRRYLEERRPQGAIWSHEKKRESAETAREYDKTSTLVTAEEEVELDCEEEDGYESDISEIEFAYQVASADAPVTQWLFEEVSSSHKRLVSRRDKGL